MEDGLSKGDVILLISSKPESDYAKKRVEEAYQQVSSFVGMVGLSESLHYREIDVNRGFLEICRDIVRVIKDTERSYGSKRLRFYLTGGMRVLIVACLMVAKLLSSTSRAVEVKVSREDRPISFVIPVGLLKLEPREITESQLEVLRLLKRFGEASFEELAIGRSEVTVRKHLTKLREKGVVSYTLKKKKQVYRLTPLGELLLELVA